MNVSILDSFLMTAFVPAAIALLVYISKNRVCFLLSVAYGLMLVMLFLAGFAIPRFIADTQRDAARQRKIAQQMVEPKRRQAALDSGPIFFRQYLGQDRTQEGVLRALQATRTRLMEAGVKGSDRQFHEYVEQYPFGLHWKDGQWAFQKGKQWKWDEVN